MCVCVCIYYTYILTLKAADVHARPERPAEHFVYCVYCVMLGTAVAAHELLGNQGEPEQLSKTPHPGVFFSYSSPRFWLYLDAEALALPPPVLSSRLCKSIYRHLGNTPPRSTV